MVDLDRTSKGGFTLRALLQRNGVAVVAGEQR